MINKTEHYFPVPESKGSFRYAMTSEEKMELCGFDGEKLGYARHYQYFLNSGASFGVVVLRNGWMADEYYTENVLEGTSFDLWSCTKSFTSMAFACLMDEQKGRISYTSKVYDFIPDEYHSDSETRLGITIGQLLSMTSGLRGSANGGIGMGVPYGHGAFEYALGLTSNRRGYMCDLLSDPGTKFDYSDAGYTLLSLAFYNITGEDMRDYVSRKILSKIGIESSHWDMQGGHGLIGPYTNGHTGLHISVRDLARVGYLLLKRGIWEGERILPELLFEQIAMVEAVNPCYGNGFWKNYAQRFILDAPEDAYFMKGYRSNRCYIVPSLDLVVARCGTGPTQWDEGKLLGEIVASII